ncbi:hypothetical protein PAM7066_00658 [Palleronia marisminoris]|uniref:Uncharacterized protein n=1 Tax=Palleronia marisminoris TaxID=315423 RepID=A0A1Y5RPK7_9RHOB|nr:hypothetical protein PAM7066_00658 [Palleronia marisminoris]
MAFVPFHLLLIALLMRVPYVPALTMFLPRMLGL